MDEWAKLIGVGIIILAWMEARFVNVKTYEDRKKDVDARLEERKKSTHDIRDALQPVTTKVAVMEHDVEWLMEAIHEIGKTVGATLPAPRRLLRRLMEDTKP